MIFLLSSFHPPQPTTLTGVISECQQRWLLGDTLVKGSGQECYVVCSESRGVCPGFGDGGKQQKQDDGLWSVFSFLWLPLGPVRFLVLSSEEWNFCKVPLYAQFSGHSSGLWFAYPACMLKLLQLWAIAIGPGSQSSAVLHSWNEQKSFKKLERDLWGQLWVVVCSDCENNLIVKKHLWHFQLCQSVYVVKIILKDRG